MVSDSERPTGLYIKYLQRLSKQREDAGLPPPAADVAPGEYWEARRKAEQDKVRKQGIYKAA
jgi:hypothetical protein